MISPFENDTSAATKLLSKRNFKANRKQNRIMIVSIALVTFMMFIIFSVGMSFFQNYQTMNIRVTGTTANGLLTNLTEQQTQTLERLDYISSVGTQIFPGAVEVGDKQIALTYYSESEWRNHIKNTVEQMEGTLPQAENEIMLSEDALNYLNIDTPLIDMQISLDIQDGVNTYAQTFLLSGWYHDYVGLSRPVGSISGNVAAAGLSGIQANANAIISQAFAEKHSCYNLTTFCVNGKTTSIESSLQDDLQLTDTQTIILVNTSSGTSASGLYTVIGTLLGGVFIMICGYLIIYNIAYISVAKDIRFYGILKTLGTTPTQLKRIVRRQTMMFSCIAIPIGLILGSAISFLAVPAILNTMLSGGGLGMAMGHTASFHPLIYLAAIIFSLITVVFSCRKPAKEASKVSPIAAVRFTGIDNSADRNFKAKGIHGTSLRQMAFRNVFRDKKKAVLVFLSLFMGLTVFLAIFTVFSSPDWTYSAIVDAPYDFCLSDATIKNISHSSQAQFNDEFMEQLSAIQGVNETEIVYGVAADLSSTDSVWKPYLEDKLQVSSVESSDLNAAPRADTAGISSSLLQTLPLSVGTYDTDALNDFESGKTIYLSPTEAEQVPPDVIGKVISIRNPMTGIAAEYTIAGILKPLSVSEWTTGDNFYHNIGNIRDNQMVSDYGKHRIAHIYMSIAGMDKIAEQPVINQILINVEPEQETSINQQLSEIQGGNPDIYVLAQSTYIETNKVSLGSIMIIGTVFSLLLLLIGLMNFVNTMTTNVYSRQKEFATLESIGMTKKQILKTLSFEGGYYALFSMALLMIVGIPLTYGLIELIREQFYFLTFKPPIFEILIIALLVIMICYIVPRRAFHRISKDSITTRLQETE